jgi:hypothetical protein
MTGDGRAVRDRVAEVMSDSRLLAALRDEELSTLRDLVWKASDDGCPEPCDPQ